MTLPEIAAALDKRLSTLFQPQANAWVAGRSILVRYGPHQSPFYLTKGQAMDYLDLIELATTPLRHDQPVPASVLRRKLEVADPYPEENEMPEGWEAVDTADLELMNDPEWEPLGEGCWRKRAPHDE